MAKSKSKSEVEFLRGEVKSLKSQNRHLKKSISRKEKREYLYNDLEEKEAALLEAEEVEKENVKVLKKDGCPKCSGEFDIIDTPKLKVYICQDCSYRVTKRV